MSITITTDNTIELALALDKIRYFAPISVIITSSAYRTSKLALEKLMNFYDYEHKIRTESIDSLRYDLYDGSKFEAVSLGKHRGKINDFLVIYEEVM